VQTFTRAAETWGSSRLGFERQRRHLHRFVPQRDRRHGDLLSLGIEFKHSRPYHPPQTCGKVERFHQTIKKLLDKQSQATTTRPLQHQIDRFVTYYNEIWPHRTVKRRTPLEAFAARTKARLRRRGVKTDGYRVRHDRIHHAGSVTLRYQGRLPPHRGGSACPSLTGDAAGGPP